VRLLLVTANIVPSSPILVTLMMEALSSSETEAHCVTFQKTAFFNVLFVEIQIIFADWVAVQKGL
jgi:hypothetical protein